MPRCPHFPAWLGMGFYFLKTSCSRKEIHIFVSEDTVAHQDKLQSETTELQDPPAFHASRQIQLSLWCRQRNQEKANYWLARKVVNGRTENYTFKKCCDVQAILKMFLCPREGIVQVQTRCDRSYCTRLMQHLRIMMLHILKITTRFHSLLLSPWPCPKVKKWHPSNQALEFCSWQWEFH